MGISPQRNSERSGQSEICQLQVSLFVDEQVLGFQISMEDSVGVAVVQSFDELKSEPLRAFGWVSDIVDSYSFMWER